MRKMTHQEAEALFAAAFGYHCGEMAVVVNSPVAYYAAAVAGLPTNHHDEWDNHQKAAFLRDWANALGEPK